MKRAAALMSLALIAMGAHADVLARRNEGSFILASSRKIQFLEDGRVAGTVVGPERPDAILFDAGGEFVVVDRLGRTAAFYSRTGVPAGVIDLPDSPTEAMFVDGALIYASIERSAVVRREREGAEIVRQIGGDVRFLRRRGGSIFATDRMAGTAVQLDERTLALTQTITVPPFCSDLEVDGRYLYFVYPRTARLVIAELRTGKIVSQTDVGAVPIDIALRGSASAVSAGEILVADPSSKRVWREERQQSVSAAFGRGFVRGLLGLGLYRPQSTEFPTGVDRVMVSAQTAYGWDSSTTTLHRLDRGRATKILQDVALELIVLDGATVHYWDGQRVAELR